MSFFLSWLSANNFIFSILTFLFGCASPTIVVMLSVHPPPSHYQQATLLILSSKLHDTWVLNQFLTYLWNWPFRLSQRRRWGGKVMSFGTWRCADRFLRYQSIVVTSFFSGCLVLTTKAPRSFETSGTTQPSIQPHVLEDWNP